jgi:hypothetical protein
MPQPLVVIVPHNLGAPEAKRRLSEGMGFLKTSYIDKIASSEVSWNGDQADVRVVALGQTVTAGLDVQSDSVRIEVHLPWLLAKLSGQLEGLLSNTARDTLRIGHTPPKP